ncbi:unnamed protein product [Ectocarpus sp. 12 AP-2014]
MLPLLYHPPYGAKIIASQQLFASMLCRCRKPWGQATRLFLLHYVNKRQARIARHFSLFYVNARHKPNKTTGGSGGGGASAVPCKAPGGKMVSVPSTPSKARYQPISAEPRQGGGWLDVTVPSREAFATKTPLGNRRWRLQKSRATGAPYYPVRPRHVERAVKDVRLFAVGRCQCFKSTRQGKRALPLGFDSAPLAFAPTRAVAETGTPEAIFQNTPTKHCQHRSTYPALGLLRIQRSRLGKGAPAHLIANTQARLRQATQQQQQQCGRISRSEKTSLPGGLLCWGEHKNSSKTA